MQQQGPHPAALLPAQQKYRNDCTSPLAGASPSRRVTRRPLQDVTSLERQTDKGGGRQTGPAAPVSLMSQISTEHLLCEAACLDCGQEI